MKIVFSKLCLTLLIILSGIAAGAQIPFRKDIKKILFLGNSITYAGTYITDVEAYFVQRDLKRTYEFINVGLPSETVSGLSEPGHAGGKFPRPDLHERLSRVLKATRPDMVFACYGINDGIYLPFNEERFRAFRAGINWLHSSLLAAKVKRVVFITPFVYDDFHSRTLGYNEVLRKYSEWLVKEGRRKHWEVIDLNGRMTAILNEAIKRDASFRLAKDQVHPGAEGHWIAAKEILRHLRQPVAADKRIALFATANNREIYKLVAQRQQVMKDAWLSATGHKRPGMAKGLPMTEAYRMYRQVGAVLDSLKLVAGD